MGSGETAPTMARVHRALFDRLGPDPVAAAILDTPYGFQENADELSARTVTFFAKSVGRDVDVASYRSRDVDAVTELEYPLGVTTSTFPGIQFGEHVIWGLTLRVLASFAEVMQRSLPALT